MSLRACLFFLLLLLGSLPAQAEIWASASLPTTFKFSSTGNDLYNFDQAASGKTSGYTFLTSLPIPLLPVVGISHFQIEAQPTDPYISDPNYFEVDSYDVALDFSTKSATFLIGYGVGKAGFSCQQTDCAGLDFSQLELHQYFTQIGVPFGTASDFHFDLRRLIGRVHSSNGVDSSTLNLQGLLLAFGFRVGF
ncbi:MAG: hypothetical protein RRB13_03535 [bacterium]|nr:hypothetical protein [bacterium]